jgi:hypothetical protein
MIRAPLTTRIRRISYIDAAALDMWKVSICFKNVIIQIFSDVILFHMIFV